MSKKRVGAEALKTWKGLNVVIRTADEALCWSLLNIEERGRSRVTFLTRIHSRLARVRTATEHSKIIERNKNKPSKGK